MIEHIFTAEEIIKGIEVYAERQCNKCAVKDLQHCCSSCFINLIKQAPYLINRQKAELPPCKIGDTAYAIKTNYHSKRVHSGKVSEMYYVGEEMKLCIVVKSVGRGQWGKDVFGTYEEAERSLQNERRTSKDN